MGQIAKMGLLYFCFLLCTGSGFSQTKLDSLLGKTDPQRLASKTLKESGKAEQRLIRKSLKTLARMKKLEEATWKKMLKGKDSLTAKNALNEITEKYRPLTINLRTPAPNRAAGVYVSRLDSLTTVLKLLDKSGIGGEVKQALVVTRTLQGRLDQAEQVRQFIRERRNQLKARLESLGMLRQLKKINKQVYYYSEQLKEWKQVLNDPKRLEKKALAVLRETKLFKDFFRKNSMLGSLFRIPDPDAPLNPANLAGLQTRAQVNGLIQQQLAAAGPGGVQQFRQQMQSAQTQINSLKNKLNQLGGGGSDEELPDFKPNQQKTKSFLQRLELGTNIQSQKSNALFPVTTDLGLSAGYKLNDKSIIGLGASYKLGLGRGWNAIRFSSEGAGLRSFIDYKIKKGIWLSGGYEMNYRSAFNSIAQLQDLSGWQQSGLIGLQKKFAVKSKLFKQSGISLLWDFMSYQQVPRGQAVLVRFGYKF